MNFKVWLPRAAALATLGLCVTSTIFASHVGEDIWRVKQAQAAAVLPKPTLATTNQKWTQPVPTLRVGTADAQTKIAEFLNVEVGSLGLTLTSVKLSSNRPLGNGLRLAEVRVEAKGDARATQAVAEWVAINREAVRLESISAGLDAQDEPVASMVLLMVIS